MKWELIKIIWTIIPILFIIGLSVDFFRQRRTLIEFLNIKSKIKAAGMDYVRYTKDPEITLLHNKHSSIIEAKVKESRENGSDGSFAGFMLAYNYISYYETKNLVDSLYPGKYEEYRSLDNARAAYVEMKKGYGYTKSKTT